MSVTRDSKPHVIVVERVDVDNHEVDWHVEHHDGCAVDHDHDLEGRLVEFHRCAVQEDLDCIGLDTLANSLGVEQIVDIKPGRYSVIGVYSFDAYNREGDFWYELVGP